MVLPQCSVVFGAQGSAPDAAVQYVACLILSVLGLVLLDNKFWLWICQMPMLLWSQQHRMWGKNDLKVEHIDASARLKSKNISDWGYISMVACWIHTGTLRVRRGDGGLSLRAELNNF